MSESSRDRLRARRRDLKQQVADGKKLPVPGYGRELWVHLRYLSWTENAEINDRHGGNGYTLPAMIDRLVDACVGVYDAPDGDIDNATRVEVDGVPVGLDHNLAGWLGFRDELPKVDGVIQPADVVRELIPKEPSIEDLHNAYALWWQVSSSEVDDTLLGESSPTPTSSEPST